MERDDAGLQGMLDFTDVDKAHSLARLSLALEAQIIEPENDVLAGNDDRLAVGRAEDIVGGHHQDPGFELGFER